MRMFILFVSLVALNSSVVAQEEGYELVWSDEFDEEGALDDQKWFHQTELPVNGSWYNGEIQHYTDRLENSYVSDGTLKIVAKKETFTDQGVTKEHTSARLNSKFAFTYGYVSIRAKMPTGIGTWPALWTLGQNIIETGGYWSDSMGTVPWPACGEIDIMEHWGDNQNFVQSALHTPSSFGDTQNKGGQDIPTVSDEFHIYTLDWTSERMIFSVDDVVHYIYEPETQNLETWPFDANQYFLFNVAILPDISSNFTESAMEVDYVRVYQDTNLSVENELVASDLQLYPNPVNDVISLKVTPKLLGANVILCSLTGQELFRQQVQSNDISIDVSGYASGIYILMLENGENQITRKVVKM